MAEWNGWYKGNKVEKIGKNEWAGSIPATKGIRFYRSIKKYPLDMPPQFFPPQG